MRSYSPPVTRQRARALYIAQAAERERLHLEEQVHQRRSVQTRTARQPRRTPANQAVAASGLGESKEETRHNAEAKERLAARKGASTDFKPSRPGGRITRGRAGAVGIQARGGGGGGSAERGGGCVSSPCSTAESRSKSTVTLGNSLGRCRIALAGSSSSKTAVEGVGGEGAEGVIIAPSPCPRPTSALGKESPQATSGALPAPPISAPAPAAAGSEPTNPPPSVSSSSPPSKPLGEVNPSVLNAKVVKRGSSGDENSSSSNGGGGVGAGGKDGTAVSPSPGCGGSNPEDLAVTGTVESSGTVTGLGRMNCREGITGKDAHGEVLPTPPERVKDDRLAVEVAVSTAGGGGAIADRRMEGAVGARSGEGAADSGSPERQTGVESMVARGVGGEALREAGARVRGKSVVAKGSTGVSPMQKRNRRELKLSEEEAAMPGAPQGPVYQVAVLETDDFEPSPNPDDEMQAVLTAAGGGGDWADLYSAVDSTRRLCIFHRDVVARDGNLAGVTDLITNAIGNLRSSMVRNALLGVCDMFSCLEHDVGKVDITPMIGGTLQRLAGDKRFICQTAAQAMEVVSRKGPGVDVLRAITPGMDDRNAEIASKSALYAEQCLVALGVGTKAGSGLPDGLEFGALASGMMKVLNGKVAEGRTAARRGFLRSRKALGAAHFTAAITEALGKTEATSLLATLNTSTRANPNASKGVRTGQGGGIPQARGGGNAAGGAGRPSIREQMMAAKRKKEAEQGRAAAGGTRGGARSGAAGGGGGDGGGSGFVIVT